MAKIFAEYFGGSLNLSSSEEKTTVELTIIRDPALAAENLKWMYNQKIWMLNESTSRNLQIDTLL